MKDIVGKYRLWGILLTVVIVSGLFWGIRSCSETPKSRDLADIARLKVGVDFSPIDFNIGKDGKFSGLQHDLLTLLLPDTTIQWVPFSSRAEALEALSSNDIELYATSFAWSTNETLEALITTAPLYVSGFALVHRPDSMSRSWTEIFDEMQDIKISIPKDADDIKVLLKNLQDFSYPTIEIEEHNDETPESLCLAVLKGAIDYTVCDRNIAQAISKRVEGLVVETGIAFDLHQVWVLNDNASELLQLINRQIEQNKGSSEWNRVLKKYGLTSH
ncbi:membrane-bound lytic transglycosylase F [Porphyromonas cangingivalis]|uniref:transporter substrate-binding domain-containing protein n=1 Tax=Porphyromonas cangingivalis TaxID=36874 RepID=UPI000D9478DD|nr:transporter substrate-binding domain-containing protein [Porphyromonas cangingivalis]SPY34521.1 membrane-bound lytic transglycosylase F [Porphyromonas cangingivalis]